MQKAITYLKSNDFSKAEAVFKKIIKKDKRNAEAHNNLGILYAKANQFELSEIYLRKAMALKNVVKNRIDLINVLNAQAKFHDSEKLINVLIEADSDNKDFLLLQAQIIRQIDKKREALAILRELYKKYKSDKNIVISFAYTLNLAQEYDEAISVYEALIHQEKNFFPAIYNCGLIYLNQRIDIDKAIKYLEKCLNIDSNKIDLLLTLASAYVEKYRFEDAVSVIEKARSIMPNDPSIYYQLGGVYIHLGNTELAIKYLDKCLMLDKSHHKASYAKANLLLQEGKLKDGYRLYQARVQRENLNLQLDDQLVQDLLPDDRLIVHSEQGIGDVLLYSRFFDAIKQNVEVLVIAVPKKLIEFLTLNFPNLQFIDEKKFKKADYPNYKEINLATCPRLLDNIDEVFKNPKIFKSDLKIKESIRTKYYEQQKKLCGLAWKSNNAKVGNHKSIPLSQIINNVTSLKNIDFINTQYGDVLEELEKQNIKIKIAEIDLFNNISATASLIDACDVVITTSNVTAHIAGVLGKKTLLLIPRYVGKFWYWGEKINIYKNVQRFYQDQDGNWDDALQKVNKALSDYLHN